jgi:hypothetical protein
VVTCAVEHPRLQKQNAVDRQNLEDIVSSRTTQLV